MDAIRSTHFQGLNDTGQNICLVRCGIGKLSAYNTSGATAFLQFFDALAANVVLGTTKPLFVIVLVANVGYENVDFYPPTVFSTACSVFSTTTAEGSTGSAAGVFAQAWVN